MKNIERIVPVSALRDNYIWAICAGSACVLVDPGEAAPAQRFLRQEGLRLSAILLTHRHADHQGGVAEFLQDATVPVFGPRSPAMPLVSHPLTGEETLQPEGFAQALKVLAVPGHTEEHLAYRWGQALFCGDTLFAGGCGRLLGGSAAQLFASLQRLAGLPADTLICCAHEYTLANLRFAAAIEADNPALIARRLRCEALRDRELPTLPATLADELATNPFLRCTEPAVIRAAENHAGHALHGPLEVFTALRAWKDVF